MNQSRPNDHGGGVLSVPGVSFDGWELVPETESCDDETQLSSDIRGTITLPDKLSALRHCQFVVGWAD